jgi:hypothetical protein
MASLTSRVVGWLVSASAFVSPSLHAQTAAYATIGSPGWVAGDVLGTDTTMGVVSTNWGWNQSRIVRDNNGKVYLVYLVKPTSTTATSSLWRLMSCCSPGWYKVAEGNTIDDVHLLMDPATQYTTIISYPNGVPVVSSSSNGFTQPQVVDKSPGGWPVVAKYKTPREYGGAGIGKDGTMCVKASREPTDTYHTYTDMICGKYDATGNVAWGARQEWYIGDRHAYDYLFPGGPGGMGSVVATSQRDVCVLNSQGTCTYSFNGVQEWDAVLSGTALGNYSSTVLFPTTASASDTVRQVDSLVTTNSLLMSVAQIQPGGTGNSTLQLRVMDLSTKQVTVSKLPSNITAGWVRLMEPHSGVFYLLWTNLGPTQSQAYLYAVKKNATTGVYEVDTSTYQDIGPTIYHLNRMIQGPVYISAPRGGTLASRNVVDAFFLTCGAVSCGQDEAESLYHFTMKF